MARKHCTSSTEAPSFLEVTYLTFTLPCCWIRHDSCTLNTKVHTLTHTLSTSLTLSFFLLHSLTHFFFFHKQHTLSFLLLLLSLSLSHTHTHRHKHIHAFYLFFLSFSLSFIFLGWVRVRVRMTGEWQTYYETKNRNSTNELMKLLFSTVVDEWIPFHNGWNEFLLPLNIQPLIKK